jgi:multiple sugar transport system substrate-binding protein
MVDDKTNPQPLQPEEVPPQMVTSSPKQQPQPLTPLHLEEHSDHKVKYFIVGGAVLFFIVIFGLLLSFLFGRNQKSEAVSLTYWGLWEDESVMKSILDEYQKENPQIKIAYTKMTPEDYREKVITRSKNGDGPDIFRFHNTWVPELHEVLSPLPQSVMTVSDFDKTFYPIHSLDLKVDEKIYGIPLSVDGLVLLYNDDLYKKAGISNAPVSWEDILDNAAKLTVKNTSGEIVTSGIALGTAGNVEHFSDIFGLFLLQNGGSIQKLNEPEAEGALESYRRFAESPDGTWDEQMPNSVNAFAQEKVAMIIVPSWEVLTVKAINPSLNVKVVPVPVIPGSKPLSLASYWAEGVSRYSKSQIEAWKFLKYLSEKETETKMFELQSKVRLFGSVYSRRDLGELLVGHQYLGAVVKQAQGEGAFRSAPVVSRTYDNGLNDLIIAYIENAINETIQGVSYAQALSTAHEGVTQVLQSFNVISVSAD